VAEGHGLAELGPQGRKGGGVHWLCGAQ
jgi:hypothetical protein